MTMKGSIMNECLSNKLIFFILVIFPACYFMGSKTSEYMIPQTIHSIQDIQKAFPSTPAQIQGMADAAIEQAQHDVDAIIAISNTERTFATSAAALDNAISDYAKAVATAEILFLVHPDASMRDMAQKQQVRLQSEFVSIFEQNKKLFEAFKSYAEQIAPTEKLTVPETYFIENVIRDFKKSGLNLPEEKQKEVKSVKNKLAELEAEFEKNISADTKSISVDPSELVGLDQDFIASLRKTDDGKVILGTDYPTYFTVMKQCSNATVRKALFEAFSNRGYPTNMHVLEQMYALRDQLAKLLGFKTFAHLNIDDTMADTPERAQEFLDKLMDKATIKAQQEIKKLTTELPKGVSLTADGKIKPWDLAFIIEQYKKKYYQLDDEKLAEYFPTQHTINQLLKIYEKFFNIEFKEERTPALWHPDVKLIKVFKGHQLIGYLLLDLEPRPGKYTHACHGNTYPARIKADGSLIPGLSTVIANFPKPLGSKPSLMKYNDVSTFFHEFGHAIHGMLGATYLGTQSGTRVKLDFVEMPSQMLEEWLYDPEILKLVSKHYQTGTSLPDEIINKLIALKQLTSGHFVLSQGVLSNLALEYARKGTNLKLDEIRMNLAKKLIPYVYQDENSHAQCNFGHLAGYGAKYYGYLWSKVFALDLFEHIKQFGLLNPEIGMVYEEKVIGKGGSASPESLLEDFLGRKPNQKAFLKDLGLNI